MGKERDRQPGGAGQGRRGQGRERHDRERGDGGFEDRAGDPGEAMPEHEFRHRIREHLARIDDALERIEERLDRLER
jgi:RNA polymerase-binding transcription factor DksA